MAERSRGPRPARTKPEPDGSSSPWLVRVIVVVAVVVVIGGVIWASALGHLL